MNQNIKNVICPFCDRIIKAKDISKMTLAKIMGKVIPFLATQGFEIRKIRKKK